MFIHPYLICLPVSLGSDESCKVFVTLACYAHKPLYSTFVYSWQIRTPGYWCGSLKTYIYTCALTH